MIMAISNAEIVWQMINGQNNEYHWHASEAANIYFCERVDGVVIC